MIKWLQFGQDIPNWLVAWVLLWGTWQVVSWIVREVRTWRRNREELRQALEEEMPAEGWERHYYEKHYRDRGPVL